MTNNAHNPCSHCWHKDGCKEVYERLGRSDAPRVVGQAVFAFLLPIAVFAGLLAVFDHFVPAFESEIRRTPALFGLSLVPTLAAMWVIKKCVRFAERKRRGSYPRGHCPLY